MVQADIEKHRTHHNQGQHSKKEEKEKQEKRRPELLPVKRTEKKYKIFPASS
ncbi:MAG: hypothetical protein ACLTTF_07490 [Oscillospiraceae bacterium]